MVPSQMLFKYYKFERNKQPMVNFDATIEGSDA